MLNIGNKFYVGSFIIFGGALAPKHTTASRKAVREAR
jgi:hypothetical protein